MAPRKPKVELSNVVVGLALALAGAIGSRFVSVGDSVTALQARSQMFPDRRDREIDQILARLAAVEARCGR